MCGIVGIAHAAAAPDRDRLYRMRDALQHRGPDDSGEFFGDRIALGFRRLSIIDLSPAGHQPMTNEDETVWIVFNGEIYNFQELRSELQAKGHAFRSKTDTETIIHGYEEWGVDVLQRLRGMFAFALWDAKRQRLFMARDRFGKKPLVYAQDRDSLVFASELQAVLRAIPKPEFNPEVLGLYFRLQFIPSPYTAFQGVKKLPPAHYLIWENGQVGVQRYWDVPFAPRDVTREEAGEEFERRFRESIRLRLISDVPLGVFLSGGLDSSIITALVAGSTSSRVQTFSIGFGERTHDERDLARLVAKKYATDHHEFTVSPNVVETLPMLMRHYGEPFADSSALAVYYVARETRKHVTVALNGDGGDENFAGYEKYAFLQQLAAVDWVPQWLRAAGAAGLVGASAVLPRHLRRKLRSGAHFIGESFLERYLDTFFVFSRTELRQLLSPGITTASAEHLAMERMADVAGRDLITKTTALDLRLYLPEGLMAKSDIATMAASLEGRSPFLDHTVVEWTAGLPNDYKISGGVRKALLRERFGHLLPDDLLRAPKHGFDLPVNQWLRGGLTAYLNDTLRSADFRSLPYFNHAYIEQLLHYHGRGEAHHGIKLWSLLCFAVWQKEMAA